MSERMKVLKLLQLEAVEILQSSIFVEDVYLQHVRSGWLCHHGLRYHTHLFPGICDLKDDLALAYGAHFPVRKPTMVGMGKQEPHQNVSDPENEERSDDADEVKGEGRGTERRKLLRFLLEDICFYSSERLVRSFCVSIN